MGRRNGWEMEKLLFVTRFSLQLTTTLTCIHYNGTQTHFHHLTRPAASTISKAPAKPTKGSKAAGEGGENKKRYCKVCKEMYSSYIYKVLKQVHVVHLDAGISNKVMAILNFFVNNIFKHIATEASNFAAHSKRSTISSWEIQTAVHLILPGEPLKRTISEGTKSVTKFSSTVAK